MKLKKRRYYMENNKVRPRKEKFIWVKQRDAF